MSDDENKPELINHPSHYVSHASHVEAFQFCEHLSFSLGNCFKYCWRAGLKGDVVHDLKKALWYLDREAKLLQLDPDHQLHQPHAKLVLELTAERVAVADGGHLLAKMMGLPADVRTSQAGVISGLQKIVRSEIAVRSKGSR